MVDLSWILSRARNMQKRFTRIEFLFEELQEQEPNFESLDIIHLIDYFYIVSENKYSKLSIQIDRPETLPKLHGDRRLILVMLDELLENTIQYSSSASVSITLLYQAESIHLLWHDAGLAREARRIKNFLKPFQRSSENRNNRLGLGLSLIYRISELHGHPMQILPNGMLLFGFELHEGKRFRDPRRVEALKHIAFLYEAGRLDQAWREVFSLEGQKPGYWLASRFRKADGIYSYLKQNEDYLQLQKIKDFDIESPFSDPLFDEDEL